MHASPANASAAAQKKRKRKAEGGEAPSRERMRWTEELHHSFKEAIERLNNRGRKVTPGKIWSEMKVKHLTRDQVASHYQKYKKETRIQKRIIICDETNDVINQYVRSGDKTSGTHSPSSSSSDDEYEDEKESDKKAGTTKNVTKPSAVSVSNLTAPRPQQQSNKGNNKCFIDFSESSEPSDTALIDLPVDVLGPTAPQAYQYYPSSTQLPHPSQSIHLPFPQPQMLHPISQHPSGYNENFGFAQDYSRQINQAFGGNFPMCTASTTGAANCKCPNCVYYMYIKSTNLQQPSTFASINSTANI